MAIHQKRFGDKIFLLNYLVAFRVKHCHVFEVLILIQINPELIFGLNVGMIIKRGPKIPGRLNASIQCHRVCRVTESSLADPEVFVEKLQEVLLGMVNQEYPEFALPGFAIGAKFVVNKGLRLEVFGIFPFRTAFVVIFGGFLRDLQRLLICEVFVSVGIQVKLKLPIRVLAFDDPTLLVGNIKYTNCGIFQIAEMLGQRTIAKQLVFFLLGCGHFLKP